MKVLDKTRNDVITCFNLKDDDFDVTLTYNCYARTLDIEICGVENYSFRDDLERELKEFALFN